jgi:hypothetical protein
MQDVRVLRRQTGRRHGAEGKEERLIHPSFDTVEQIDNGFLR